MDIDQRYPYPVRINWTDDHNTVWWNECCAMVLEVFGLPGDKFYYRPSLDHMIFSFVSEKDAYMCKILLSDRL